MKEERHEKERKNLKKVLSIVLCIAMTLAYVPMTPFNASAATAEETTCDCIEKCTEEATNSECSVCSNDITSCTGLGAMVVTTLNELQTAVQTGGLVKMGADIDTEDMNIYVPGGVTTLVDLNGKALTNSSGSFRALGTKGGTLTIMDSVGSGSISGDYAAVNCYSGTITINGGTFSVDPSTQYGDFLAEESEVRQHDDKYVVHSSKSANANFIPNSEDNTKHDITFPCCDTVITEDHTAGSYSVDGNSIVDNCIYCGEELGKLTITASNEVYNGEAKEAQITGSIAGVTTPEIVYEALDGGSLTDGKPVNAGKYTASITIEDNDGEEYTASVSFEIEKAGAATIITAPTANELIYNGNAQELVTAGTAENGTLVYSLSENGEYTTEIPTATDAGEYTVWYYAKGDVNHTDSAKASVNVVIEAAEDDVVLNGLIQAEDGTWYYYIDGEVAVDYTGLVEYYGAWFYVEGGVLNWNYTGLTLYYDTWYYVEGGILNWGYTGLTEYYDTWYYVNGGVLDWGYTGLTEYYGAWYYVEGGILNWNYTGTVYYNGTWWYVENGVLVGAA